MIDFIRLFSSEPSQCSYLPDQTSRLPMNLPSRALEPMDFDRLMESGYRRSGAFYYNTQCPHCQACQPIRLEVAKFCPNRSQRRAIAKSSHLRFELCQPSIDQPRVDLFNLHRQQRGLAKDDSPISAQDYAAFLLPVNNGSLELSVWMAERLIAVSITDVGLQCLSAVYCFFDPNYSNFSLGTLCVLKQIELAQLNHLRWLYLGYYVAANAHLSYKSNFRPHQMRIDGQWQDGEDSGSTQ
jgi:arginine-tRNA-protein transferase